MIASRVHAVIAAGLENPHLLTLWRREPDQLRHHGIEPEDLDLSALWKFAGLTAKVRHNGLRTDLPLTFRLLNVAGLEIEVFASYASFMAAAGRRYASTAEGRAQDLLSFLEQWLDFDKREHVLLWDLIRYELALTQLSRMATSKHTFPSTESRSSSTRPKPNARSVAHLCGEVVLYEMSCDPVALGAKLQEKSPRLADVPLGTFHVCYWRRDATSEIHIMQLDELGFYLLSFADGERSAANLSCLLGGRKTPSKGFLKALAELAAVGIISFDSALEQIP
jgi:hypothetical protein